MGEELLLGPTSSKSSSVFDQTLFITILLLLQISQVLSTFIDSGADTNIFDEGLARQLGIGLQPLPCPVPAQALDGHLLGTVTHQTVRVHLLMSGNHHETIQFHVLSKATSLPPHCPYDCVIDLLPGTSPPKGRLYSLSGQERQAMEKYITLAAGIIQPSSSPAGAGIFFVENRYISQTMHRLQRLK